MQETTVPQRLSVSACFAEAIRCFGDHWLAWAILDGAFLAVDKALWWAGERYPEGSLNAIITIVAILMAITYWAVWVVASYVVASGHPLDRRIFPLIGWVFPPVFRLSLLLIGTIVGVMGSVLVAAAILHVTDEHLIHLLSYGAFGAVIVVLAPLQLAVWRLFEPRATVWKAMWSSAKVGYRHYWPIFLLTIPVVFEMGVQALMPEQSIWKPLYDTLSYMVVVPISTLAMAFAYFHVFPPKLEEEDQAAS